MADDSAYHIGPWLYPNEVLRIIFVYPIFSGPSVGPSVFEYSEIALQTFLMLGPEFTLRVP